jgi:hypothetical protein
MTTLRSSKATQISTTDGRRLTVEAENNHGVVTEAGLIAWAQVACFWVWSRSLGRVVSVPVN